jgi:hypothetical protein
MNWISANIFWFKLAGVAIVIAAIFGSGVYVTKNHYEAVIAQNQVEHDKAVQIQKDANLKLLADISALRTEKETEHAINQQVVNDLTQRNAALSRVRIHIPSSGAGCSGSTSGQSADGRSRLLSEKIDAALAEVQSNDGADSARCDQLNIDTIRLNGEVR